MTFKLTGLNELRTEKCVVRVARNGKMDKKKDVAKTLSYKPCLPYPHNRCGSCDLNRPSPK
jgi:hypothetical protein